MTTYVFEARYRGVPRQATLPVRDYLRGQVDVPGSGIKEVRAVHLDSRGFRIRLHLVQRGQASVVGAIMSAETQCALALEAAWRDADKLSHLLSQDVHPYCISCEVIA